MKSVLIHSVQVELWNLAAGSCFSLAKHVAFVLSAKDSSFKLNEEISIKPCLASVL